MSTAAHTTTSKVRYIVVHQDEVGQRLDNYLLTKLKGLPKTHLYRLLRTGRIRVNKGRKQPTYRVEGGDSIRIPPLDLKPLTVPQNREVNLGWLEDAVLYEDQNLIVINKPSGLAVHGGSGVTLGLIESLRILRPQIKRLELVHRLDKATSGCILVAKKPSVLRNLHDQLRGGKIKKYYVALVAGILDQNQKTVDAALDAVRTSTGEKRVRVDSEGKESKSRLSVIHRYNDATLIRIQLLTGRTHQARVHCTHIGHPIAGDDKYGDKEKNEAMSDFGLRRLFLHAERLEFAHPVSGERIVVEATLPRDLQIVLDHLKPYAQ